MNRAALSGFLVLLLASPSLADPAGRQALESIIRTHGSAGPFAVLHAVGSQDLEADMGDVVAAVSAAKPNARLRRLLAGVTRIRARAGSARWERLAPAEVPFGPNRARIATRLSYRVAGRDLLDVAGLEFGSTTLAPVNTIRRAGPAQPAAALLPSLPLPGIQPLARTTPSTPSAPAVPSATSPTASTVPAASAPTTPSGPASVGAAHRLLGGPTLARGSRGAKVRTLQELLNKHRPHGSARMRVDGIFGAGTERALRAFQSANALSVTGRTDSNTWARLRAPRPMSSGAEGEDVRQMQRLLNWARRAAGLPPVAEDGDFGRGTERAVKAFQSSQGLPATGNVDGPTYRALEAMRPRGSQGSPLLQQGDRSASVRSLQWLLNQHRQASGLAVIGADSDFGPSTERALRDFQSSKGLPAHGVSDTATWTALRATPVPVSTQPTVLARGSRGNEVRAVQRRLNRHREVRGASRVGEDGIFGAGTERALKEFQRRNKLSASGRVDAPTLRALNRAPATPNPTTPTAPAPPSDGSLRGLRVAIDSGHGITGSGVFDPGAVNRSTGITEYELNAEAARRVKRYLEARGARVTLNIYARGSRRNSLYQKGAKAAGHHIFVSIHHNAFNRRAQGSVTLVHQSRATSQSLALGRSIQRQLVSRVWRGASNRDRGVRRQGLGVLRGAHSKVRTAVLVEGFFLDHTNMTRSRAMGLVELESRAIADGIGNYWKSR